MTTASCTCPSTAETTAVAIRRRSTTLRNCAPIVRTRLGADVPTAFGPSLAIGTVLVILLSAPILDFYGFTDDAAAPAPATANAFSGVTPGR